MLPTITKSFTSVRRLLIRAGKAYVDSQSAEEMRQRRGTLTEPGSRQPLSRAEQSPKVSISFSACVPANSPTAVISSAPTSIWRRRISICAIPPSTGSSRPSIIAPAPTWCIYPMYDFAHPISDALEGITHSICTLEFEDHRPLYDWVIDNLPLPARPRQYEFARLNLTYTVMSKRKLLELVSDGHVAGWDDPRLPTLSGLRRRGYPPAAIRTFCERIGVGRNDNWIDMSVLEDCVREELNESAPRVMAVLRPLKVVIENYPEGEVEEMEVANHPANPDFGVRTVPFGREIYIEQDDFAEAPPKGFFRLAPGKEVRLRNAYFITCTGGGARSGQWRRSSSCAAAMTLPAAAVRLRTVARSRGRFTGSRRAPGSSLKSVSTTASSACRSRGSARRSTILSSSIPTPWRFCAIAAVNRGWPWPIR